MTGVGVVPRPEANDRPHLAENQAVIDFELSNEEANRLEECNEHASALGDPLAYT